MSSRTLGWEPCPASRHERAVWTSVSWQQAQRRSDLRSLTRTSARAVTERSTRETGPSSRSVKGRPTPLGATPSEVLGRPGARLGGRSSRPLDSSRVRANRPNLFDGAIEDATKVIEIDPRYKQAWNIRARSRANVGDTKNAISDFERFLELGPADPAADEARQRLAAIRRGGG